ncbi:hypothetical protein NQ317_003750 [Molorchus minor]|uniref:Uncharacterized protein n=1 Tax=Molorchus minor TaxID=1323400 RepID=A0ABQ9JS80_9CUCU|nr:hypothetical protein NQ317_003750 [Molorchus minor]
MSETEKKNYRKLILLRGRFGRFFDKNYPESQFYQQKHVEKITRGDRSRMFLLIENYPESKTREIFYQQKHE